MTSPTKEMLQAMVETIRNQCDDDEDFSFLVNIMFHDFAVQLGELMVDVADGTDHTCPLHAVGHFVCSMTMSVTAAMQDAADERAAEPAPAPPPKQVQLALVPITPAPSPEPPSPATPRFITPAEMFNLRKAKGLSQKQVGQLVGLSAGTISRWERGDPKFEPSVREYLTMQAALGWTG